MIAQSEKERLFEKILVENRCRLRLFARANTRGDDSRDLEQEILLQLWRSLDLYEGRSNLKTWFYGIAYHTLRDFDRANNRPETPLEHIPPARLQSTARTEETIDALHMLEGFMRSLGELDRTVLLMYFDGCSYQEMSEATETDGGALRVRVSRLKKQLAKYAGS